MEKLYPEGPKNVPAKLTAATSGYRKHAWLAMLGLLFFVFLYLFMTGWFAWTAYDLIRNALNGDEFAFLGYAGGVASAFLAIFTFKALFFVNHRGEINDLEVTAENDPDLFSFLYRLADEAGAPRPHRVFLSGRVNAAVFYDLSILNLLFPSKKNLEIGLPLVNCLNLGELKAVLAHEFGHFAQKSMAVGRWVYVSQQIASHIINKRDGFDKFLVGLGRADLRFAWIGWIMSLIIWSIRSLLETVFSLVVMAQRALSREMEFQADLVAVSLTGSDALIHALHRLAAADDGWDRAVNFAGGQLDEKRMVDDLFPIQKRIIEHLRTVLSDPEYGAEPVLPDAEVESHRLFKTALAHPPKMWATHPENSAREENAKRVYVSAPLDKRSAWDLFANPIELGKKMTAHLFASHAEEAEAMPVVDAVAKVDEQYNNIVFNKRYRGAYLGRSVARNYASVSDMYDAGQEVAITDFAALYPESLVYDLENYNNLLEEKSILEAIKDGHMQPYNGIIRHRDDELQKREIPAALDTLKMELKSAADKLNISDKAARTKHRNAAINIGNGWDNYLTSLASVLHYADHYADNLSDIQGYMHNVLNVIFADNRVSDKELKRLLKVTAEVHLLLSEVYQGANNVSLNEHILKELGHESWEVCLGEFTLPAATRDNINDWMQVIDGWLSSAVSWLSALRRISLEQLLLAEDNIAKYYVSKQSVELAPTPCKVPTDYKTFVLGSERKRQTKLNWWDSFHTASGVVPAILRTGVACLVVGSVLGAGTFLGGALSETSLAIYNGLSIPVNVEIGENKALVSPFSSKTIDVITYQDYQVQALTLDGKEIESFTTKGGHVKSKTVYNIAGAGLLIKWWQIYGDVPQRNDEYLESPRWSVVNVDHIFEEPPETISSNSNATGGYRTILAAYGSQAPNQLLELMKDEGMKKNMITAHASWDGGNAIQVGNWLNIAASSPDFEDILENRLERNPHEVWALRAEQSVSDGDAKNEVCMRHAKLSQSLPDDINLKYITTRCLPDEEVRDQAYIDANQQYPDHPWFAYAAGYTQLDLGQWGRAEKNIQLAYDAEPSLRQIVASDLARLRRANDSSTTDLSDLAEGSGYIRDLVNFETGDGFEDSPFRAFSFLNNGDVAEALQAIVSDRNNYEFLLRLAHASDNRGDTVATKVASLSGDAGVDYVSVWSALGSAVRDGNSTKAFIQVIKDNYGDAEVERVNHFLEQLASGSLPDIDGMLSGSYLELRGYYFSLGTIILGDKAPIEWRQKAKRLLFISERPYFK